MRGFSLLYNLPLFALGLLWLLSRWRQRNSASPRQLWLDGLVVALSLARFFGIALPPSGHAFFLTHSGLTTPQRSYQLASAVFLVLTIALKLSWGDSSSWLWGIVAGCASGAVYQQWNLTRNMEER
jgi:uncharacterized membrane protein